MADARPRSYASIREYAQASVIVFKVEQYSAFRAPMPCIEGVPLTALHPPYGSAVESGTERFIFQTCAHEINEI